MKLRSIFSWFIIGMLAIIPLFFLATTQDYYDTNKWFLFVLTALLLIVSASITLFYKKRVDLTMSPMATLMGAFTISSAASVYFVSTNKIEALLSPFGPILFASCFVIFSVAPIFVTPQSAKRFMSLLYLSASCLGLLAVYQYFGLGKAMFPKVSYLANPLWTPTGSSIATFTLLIILLPQMIIESIHSVRLKHETRSALMILATSVAVIGFIITGWQLVSRISGTLLPIKDGWAILLEILKNPKNAFFGVGAENFLTAFNSGRLQSYNLSPLWSVRFTTNSNLLFHLTTIYGLLGGIMCIFILKSLVSQKLPQPFRISVILGVIMMLITPPNISVFIIILLLFLCSDMGDHKTIAVKMPHHIVLRILIAVIFIGFIAPAFYFVGRAYAAEHIFYKSLQAAAANNGSGTYNAQIKAIGYNPYLSRFHVTYSQTSLVLATALSNSLASSNPPPSDDEKVKNRDLIAQLVQQSIKEAKLAVKLNPSSILGWENLARTYNQLIDVAQGADTWAIASFQQSIILDPNNPSLHIELGSIYVKTKNYTESIVQFQKAISLKPNYANAYYNLANAYIESGDTVSAVQALKQTLLHIDPHSADYTKVSDEIDALEKGKTPSTESAPTQKTSNNSVTK